MATYLLLENLPSSFGPAALKSLLSHVTMTKKAKLCSTYAIEGGRFAAVVSFEAEEDKESAVTAWQQLSIDSHRIVSTPLNSSPFRGEHWIESLHYPFGPINVSWIVEFVANMKSNERHYVMCKLLECLMCAAVSSGDYFMEQASEELYQKFSPQHWVKASQSLSDNGLFDLTRKLFAIMTKFYRFSTSNVGVQRTLLSLIESAVSDIEKSSASQITTNTAVPEICNNINTAITELRKQLPKEGGDPSPAAVDEQMVRNLTSWLNFLFACVTSYSGTIPSVPQIQPCSDKCPCYTLVGQYNYLLGDVEKVKILDLLVIHAVRANDELIQDSIRELGMCLPFEYCQRVVQPFPNGVHCLSRLRLFEAMEQVRNSTGMPDMPAALDRVEVCLRAVLQATADSINSNELKSIEPLTKNALVCLRELRAQPQPSGTAMQQTYTLQYDLNQMFNHLSAPTLMLCTHPTDITKCQPYPRSAYPSRTQCGNETCNRTDNLMKCSACHRAYYCSVDCQRASWRSHKMSCKLDLDRRSAIAAEETDYQANEAATGSSTIIRIQPVFPN